MSEQNKKQDKRAHGNSMQTDFIKYCTHPGTTNGEKCTEHEMCCNGGYIWQISEYVTGPEIEKHGNYKTNQPVLSVFKGQTFNQLQPPGKEQTKEREKYGE